MNRKLMRNIDGQVNLADIYEITASGIMDFKRNPTLNGGQLTTVTTTSADGVTLNILKSTNQVEGIIFNVNSVTGTKVITFPNLAGTVALLQEGKLPVNQGGTGLNTVAANGILYGNGNDPLGILEKNTGTIPKYIKSLNSSVGYTQIELSDILGFNIEITSPINFTTTTTATINYTGNPILKVGHQVQLSSVSVNSGSIANVTNINDSTKVYTLTKTSGTWTIGNTDTCKVTIINYTLANLQDSVDKKHSQNSDTGTSASKFIINSSSSTNKITLDTSGTAKVLELKDKDEATAGLKISTLILPDGQFARYSEGIIWGTITVGITTNNIYPLTFSKTPALLPGTTISFKAPTFSIGTNGATILGKSIVFINSDGLQVNYPVSRLKGIVTLRYDGSNFFPVGEGGDNNLTLGADLIINPTSLMTPIFKINVSNSFLIGFWDTNRGLKIYKDIVNNFVYIVNFARLGGTSSDRAQWRIIKLPLTYLRTRNLRQDVSTEYPRQMIYQSDILGPYQPYDAIQIRKEDPSKVTTYIQNLVNSSTGGFIEFLFSVDYRDWAEEWVPYHYGTDRQLNFMNDFYAFMDTAFYNTIVAPNLSQYTTIESSTNFTYNNKNYRIGQSSSSVRWSDDMYHFNIYNSNDNIIQTMIHEDYYSFTYTLWQIEKNLFFMKESSGYYEDFIVLPLLQEFKPIY